MNATGTFTPSQEWKLYWPLVLASVIGFSFHSVATYATGLFMEPLSEEFGWSRAQISAGLTLAALISVPLAPFVGAAIDRWGTRRLAIPALVLSSAALASLGLANGSAWQWYGLWTFYAIASLGVKSTIWTAAVSGVFTASRGLALAVVLCGTAITQTLAPPLTQWLIDDFGWRFAFFSLGIGWGLLAFVLAVFCLYDVHDQRKQALEAGEVERAPVLAGLEIRDALRSVPLYRIAIATLILMTLTIGVIVHQVPILTEVGISRQNAAYLASLGGIAGIVGKLVTGFLMDRYNASWVGGLTMSVLAIAFLLLLESLQAPALIVTAMVIIGYSAGSMFQICAYLTSRYGGMRNFGKIFSIMAVLVALGSGLGPMLAGAVFDIFGSYQPLIIAGIPCSLLCGMLLIGLGPYPEWEEEGEEARLEEAELTP